jgi:uncharacterized membrane protein
MTRQEFLTNLRAGLAGLPAATIAEVTADYQAHFAEGEAAGRSDEDIAAGLGDPVRLARELRAETGLKAWQETRTPSTAVGAVFAFIGLGAIDIIFLLPILMAVAGVIFALAIAAAICLAVGGGLLVSGPFYDGPGGAAGAMLAGLGLMAGATAGGAALTLVSIGLMNALVWYGRLHYRLLEPAIQPQV